MWELESAPLVEGGGLYIYADFVDRAEVYGPIVKLVLVTIRVTGDRIERRETATLIMPWESWPGGVTGLRQAFGDRVIPALSLTH